MYPPKTYYLQLNNLTGDITVFLNGVTGKDRILLANIADSIWADINSTVAFLAASNIPSAAASSLKLLLALNEIRELVVEIDQRKVDEYIAILESLQSEPLRV